MSHRDGNRPFPQPYTPAPRPPKNGLGVAALVLGILGFLFAFLPIVGVVAWPMVILGLIFGLIGISRARKGQADNKGVAIAGTVLSALGLLVCFLWVGALASTDPTVNANGAPVITTATGLAPVSPPAALTTALPDGSYGDGTYEVGPEIPLGTYKTEGPGEGGFPCTWTKAKTADVDSAPTSGDVVQGQSTVTIRSSGFMKFSGGCVWVQQ